MTTEFKSEKSRNNTYLKFMRDNILLITKEEMIEENNGVEPTGSDYGRIKHTILNRKFKALKAATTNN